MINHVELDGIRYDYESGSWTRAVPVKSSRTSTQNSPTYQYDGLDSGTQNITLFLQTWLSNWGVSTSGTSQLASLEATYAKLGTSMPVTWVAPTGVTYSVVPLSSMDISQFQRYGASGNPNEYTVQIQLGEV